MALVKCPDCGRDVSDAAPTCPGCGRPMSRGPSCPKCGSPWTPGRPCPSCGAITVGSTNSSSSSSALKPTKPAGCVLQLVGGVVLLGGLGMLMNSQEVSGVGVTVLGLILVFWGGRASR